MNRLLKAEGTGLDLEASEMAIRESMHQVGGVILEKVVNAEGRGYRGTQLDCGQGHPAQFVEYRQKQLLTVLGPVRVERAYYYCEECGHGVVGQDEELDIVGTRSSGNLCVNS